MKKFIGISILSLFFFLTGCETYELYVKRGLEGVNLYELELYGEKLSGSDIKMVEMSGFRVEDFTSEEVAYYIKFYQNNGRAWFQTILNKAALYLPYIKEVFQAEGIPEDLIYLPIIESSFNPRAVSKVGAAGLWQFMPRTGEIYGLKVNYWVDDRFDPERSTKAAAKHLKILDNNFKSWVLSLAAYNAGGGRISRAIKKGKTNKFWELARDGHLPKETMNYIPKYIAAVMIAKNPAKFGFTIPKPNIIYPEGDIVYIDDAADLKIISELISVSYEDITALNPQLSQWVTPPNVKRYPLRIPGGKADLFDETFGRIPAEERVTFRRHVVKMNETLSHISKFYGVPQSAILDINKIKKSSFIQIGQNILIPIRGLENAEQIDMIQYEEEQKRMTEGKFVEFSKLEPPEYEYKDVLYCVQPGDSLWIIARKYKIDIDQIKAWNKIKGNTLTIGEEIFLRIPVNK